MRNGTAVLGGTETGADVKLRTRAVTSYAECDADVFTIWNHRYALLANRPTGQFSRTKHYDQLRGSPVTKLSVARTLSKLCFPNAAILGLE